MCKDAEGSGGEGRDGGVWGAGGYDRGSAAAGGGRAKKVNESSPLCLPGNGGDRTTLFYHGRIFVKAGRKRAKKFTFGRYYLVRTTLFYHGGRRGVETVKNA